MTARLRRLAESEAGEERRIQQLYAALDDEVYKLYGIPDDTRAIIEETLGERPPEVLWPQMERKTAEQKRIEHVWRLLSYVVKRVVEADEDGVVPSLPCRARRDFSTACTTSWRCSFPSRTSTWSRSRSPTS